MSGIDWESDAYKQARANEPTRPTFDRPITVVVVAKRCVYINDHRVAGGKPYVSEGLPQHELKTKLGDVISAFREEDILAALEEQRARNEHWRAFRETAPLAEQEIGGGK